MGDKVLKIGTVHQCNCCLGSKTLHPLVSVIDLSKADLSPHTDIKFGFYTILLSECKCEAYAYGHQYCDFSDGTLVCLTPGESISMKGEQQGISFQGMDIGLSPRLDLRDSARTQYTQLYFLFLLSGGSTASLSTRKTDYSGVPGEDSARAERCIDRHSKKNHFKIH